MSPIYRGLPCWYLVPDERVRPVTFVPIAATSGIASAPGTLYGRGRRSVPLNGLSANRTKTATWSTEEVEADADAYRDRVLPTVLREFDLCSSPVTALLE